MNKNDEQERNQWECLPNETAIAYNAFLTYLELGPNNRSIYKAQMVSQNKPYNTKGPKLTSSRWKTWSRNHRWVSRASDYDSYNTKHRMRLKEERLIISEEEMAEDQKLFRMQIRKRLIDNKDIDNIPPHSLIRAYKDSADTELKVLGHEAKSRVTNVNDGNEPVTTIRVEYVMSRKIQGDGGIDIKISEDNITYSDEPTVDN